MMATAFLGFIGPKWLCLYSIYVGFTGAESDVSSIQCVSILLPIVCSPRLQQFIDKHNIKPVLVFEDLTNPKTQKTAYRTLKPFSGIYLVVNLINGKYYVGSAVTGNIYMRMHKHLFTLIGNIRVANAVKKYGLQEFAFLVLEIVPQDETVDATTLLNREDYYIQELKPEYNIAPQATNSVGWKHSEESRQKMRKNYSEERRQRVAKINKGKTLSEETRKLLREAALQRKPMSLESRLKCVSNVRPVTITNLDGTNLRNFSNVVEASKAIGCSAKTIRRALNCNGILQRKYVVSDTIDS